MEKFSYCKDDLIETSPLWSEETKLNLSPFDKLLQKTWKEAESKGLFNYPLSDNKYKCISGERDGMKMDCLALLNINRVLKRRAPHIFKTMNEPFNKNSFNFTKINPGEILVEISSRLTVENLGSKDKSYVIINASPIDNFHVLIVPEMHSCQPQKLTADSILLATDILQLSSQPSFRLGFNSLHAWASVNHLHLHGMYSERKLFIDDFPCGEKISNSCALINDRIPIPGFVFTIPFGDKERIDVAQSIETFLNVFHESNIPYTIILTRGSSAYKTRCFVWPRKSTSDMEPSDVFNVACVEAGGLFSVRTSKEFDVLTFEKSMETLADSKIDSLKFKELLEKVKKIFPN